MVDFEYDKTFLKSMVSDFYHFVLSVAGGVESSKNLKSMLTRKNLRVIII